jgi:hypothetical protein
MKYLYIITIIFCGFEYGSAQAVKGLVCDKDTKEPIPYVYVYFDGTSINTLTDTLGRFRLEAKSVMNAKLVLQQVAYQTFIVDRPFANLPDTLFLEEKPDTLGEVSVSAKPDRFTRNRKLQAFREQFLGLTSAGRSCTIQNENDIHLVYNMKTHRLLASCDVPIVVINNYLGYKVLFTLMDFWAEYRFTGLNKNDLWKSFFSTVSSFTDLNLDNKKINQHRDEVYRNSSKYFFNSFVNNSLDKNGFKLYSKGHKFDLNQYFRIIDTLSQKGIIILPNTDITKNQVFFEERPLAVIGIYNSIDNESDIYFMTDSLLVDRYGNIDQIEKVLITGQMAENRAGDMLPNDYEP